MNVTGREANPKKQRKIIPGNEHAVKLKTKCILINSMSLFWTGKSLINIRIHAPCWLTYNRK